MAREELRLVFTVDREGMVSVKDLKKNFAKTKANVDKTSKSLKSMSGLLRAGMVTTGLESALSILGRMRGALSALDEQLEQGIEANRVQRQFEWLTASAGEAATSLEKLRSATAGEVAATELQQKYIRLNRAMEGVAGAGLLIGDAWQEAQVNGRNFERTYRQIFSAVATGQTESAMQLGFLVSKTDAYAAKARELGVEVGWLTEQQQRQAVQETIVRQAQERSMRTLERTGGAYRQAKAAAKDFESAVQQAFAGGTPAGMHEVYQDILGADSLAGQVTGLTARLSDIRDIRADIQADVERAQTALAAAPADDAYAYRRLTAEVTEAQDRLTEFGTQYQRVLGEFDKASNESIQAASAFMSQVSDVSDVMLSRQSSSYEMLAGRLEEYRAGLQRQYEAYSALQIVEGGYADRLDTLRSKLEQLGAVQQERSHMHELLERGTLGSVHALEEELAALVRSGDAHSDRAAQIRTEIGALEELHQSVFALGRQLEKTGGHGGITWAEQLGLTAHDDIVQAAAAMEHWTKAKKAADAAFSSGTLEEQEAAYEAVRDEVRAMRYTLHELGLEQKTVQSLTEGLAGAVSGYALQLDVARQRTDSLTQATADLISGGVGQLMAAWQGSELAQTVTQQASAVSGWAGGLLSEAVSRAQAREAASRRTSGGGGEILPPTLRDSLDVQSIREQTERARLALLEGREKVAAQVGLEIQAAHREANADMEQIEDLAARWRQAGKELDPAVIQQYEDAITARHTAQVTAAQQRLSEWEAQQETPAQAAPGATQGEIESLNRLRNEYREVTGTQDEWATQRREILRQPIRHDIDAQTQELQLQILAIRRHREEMREMGDVARGVGAAFGEVSSQVQGWASTMDQANPLGERGQQLMRGLDEMSTAVGGLVDVWGEGDDAIAGAAAGVSSAVGGAVASMMPGIGKAALLMSLMSAANAAFLAFLNPAQAVQQGVAATTYGIVANMAGIGGSGGRNESRAQTSLGTATPTQASGGDMSFTINMGGSQIVRSDAELGEVLTRSINAAVGSGAKIRRVMVQ